MLAHGAPLNGQAVAPSSPPGTGPSDPGGQQGGIGFTLPPPGTPRLNSLTNPPQPIPAGIKTLYLAAADRYHLPWTLLAGIGMEETAHGRTTATSSAGAQGLMQFMPATWALYGVDGDGDGRADITNDADSAMSAANYLTASGVTAGPDGVRTRDLRLQPRRLVRQRRPLLRRRLRRRHRARRPQRLRTRRDRQPQPAPHRQRRDRRTAHLGPDPHRRPLRLRRQRTGRLGLLQLHPGRLRPDRDQPSPAPPPPNATGSPPATDSASPQAKNDQGTCCSSTATSAPTRSATS
jgi:hypothetical protein